MFISNATLSSNRSTISVQGGVTLYIRYNCLKRTIKSPNLSFAKRLPKTVYLVNNTRIERAFLAISFEITIVMMIVLVALPDGGCVTMIRFYFCLVSSLLAVHGLWFKLRPRAIKPYYSVSEFTFVWLVEHL